MLFLTFEGLDGSGKSTQVQRLQQRLREAEFETICVREPGGTALSERVRDVLLDARLNIDPFAEMLLFSAARRQLVQDIIRPALAAGKIVLCDRFFDSTTAYQGGGRELESVDWIDSFNRHVTGGLVPNRTFYLRLPPAVAANRRQIRSKRMAAADRIEDSGTEFFERVAGAYDQISSRERKRFRTMDATRSIDEIAAEVWQEVASVLHRAVGTGGRLSG